MWRASEFFFHKIIVIKVFIREVKSLNVFILFPRFRSSGDLFIFTRAYRAGYANGYFMIAARTLVFHALIP
jgi:hypothetical protein